MSDFQQRIDVDSQKLLLEETAHQESGSDTEPFLENQTKNTPVQCFNNSQEKQPEIRKINTDMTAIYS